MPLAPEVDHFTIIRNPSRLLELFIDRLGLPLVWPHSDFGTFGSAAVQAGNLLLEMARPKFSQPSDYAITLLAGDRLRSTLAGFDQVGLPYLEPWCMDMAYPCPWEVPHRRFVNSWLLAQPGMRGLLWKIAAVPAVLPSSVGLLVADYYIDFAPLSAPTRAELEARSRREESLGWINVKSFLVRVPQETLQPSIAQLAKLMGDAETVGGSGARVLLETGHPSGFVGLVVRVRSLSQARDYLARRDLLGRTGEQHVSVSPDACPDFEIRFVRAA